MGTLLGAAIVFLVGMATGVMCQEHVSRRNLTNKQYTRCVQHVLVEYGDQKETCRKMIDEIERYQDEACADMHDLSPEVEKVIRLVTDEWE